ncbi:MAG TPA: amidohydrolase family protein [Actinomycetota bacterium]
MTDGGEAGAIAGRHARPEGARTIDIHCHVLSADAEELARPAFSLEKDPFLYYSGPASTAYNQVAVAEVRPKLTGVEERLADMDRMGVDIQAISVAPPQYYYWAEPDLGQKLARMQNDNLARMVAAHPDRFVGLGTVPLQDVGATLDELDRIAHDLRFPGIEICTNVNGEDFDDHRFLPFFERCRDLDLAVVVHPNGFTHGDRLASYYMINTVGMPLDSTVFLARMIFGGVLERVPDIKMCVVHAGGYLPSYPARYDHAWRARADVREFIPDHPPSHYLERLHFDSMLYEPRELAILVDRYGPDRVLLGTDYPYDMGEDDPLELICSLEGMSDAELSLILGGNAARLLNLEG